MDDIMHSEQYYILHLLEEWNTYRETQNIFIDYRSWSGIFQTLSMYANLANIGLNEILFLTPVQVHAVELSRSGVWAESFREYIYSNFSIHENMLKEFDFFTETPEELNNMHKVRDEMLYRVQDQTKPKLVIILDGEGITPKMLKDCNRYLHLQTIVCFDSARYHDDDSIANSVKKPIKHTFLNEEAGPAQLFLHQALEKRMIPLSKDPDVRVHEYTRKGFDVTKLPKPLISCVPGYMEELAKSDHKIVKGSLIYTTNYNWGYSLEPDRYYLIKGCYVIVDSMSRRFGVNRITCHPTYTKYKYKVVPNVSFMKLTTPCLVDGMPPWKFRNGGIIVPKILRDINDARRVYNAVNFFWDKVNFFIV